ncbi:carboxymuconolactone decarboxylase family protein [Kordiimonas aquimaris]|uniref:carboxymuconolactone decarboxylase family protein n=1 Tax=Kordiimonas aquimaris TaxID=707591 RepID=UPI0021D3AE07|nr:peroxidase-related enzyme [Kordiimonas aquimaris]
MSWITTLNYDNAKGKLKAIYERVKGPDNNIDNILMAHSLRPHTLEGHMTLYKYVLHHPGNKLPKWLLEAIGVYVSLLNECTYCVDHHYAGLARLLNDNIIAKDIRTALDARTPSAAKEHLSQRDIVALEYAAQLTTAPAGLNESDIEDMRAAGLSDGEILEVNQVTAYFAYANRTVLGLGVTTNGDIIGLSPNDNTDPDNWGHQ